MNTTNKEKENLIILKARRGGITMFIKDLDDEILEKLDAEFWNLVKPPAMKIRDKYLNKEDIESLGFAHTVNDIYSTGNNLITYGIDEDRFVGTIKNISELKMILKMISYERLERNN